MRELAKSCGGQKHQSLVDKPGVLIRVGKSPIKITPEITPENLELESSVQGRTKLGRADECIPGSPPSLLTPCPKAATWDASQGADEYALRHLLHSPY